MSLQLLAIFIGGGIGAAARFLLARSIQAYANMPFPVGILVVNVLGSLLIGLLWVIMLERFSPDGVWRAAILIGVLGGFTTFSSFSLDTVNLIINGELVSATLYILASVLLCLLGTWLGILCGRSF